MERIGLSTRQRQALWRVVRRSGDGRQVRRAYALLALDAGERTTAVAARLGVTRQSVWHWKRRWQRGHGQSVDQALRDRAHPGRPPTKRRIVAGLLPTLLGSPPRELGYRPSSWTVPLLRQHIQRAEGVAVSCATVARALRGLNYRYKRPRYTLSRRSPTWRQAKGGSNAVYATASAQ